MSTIHHEVFDRDHNDRDEVIVGYTFTPGCKPHFGSWSYAGDPGYGPEVEIVTARHGVTYDPVKLTEAETQRITESLAENHREAA